MAKIDFLQSNFTAGELSPRLRGRVDFERFFDGAERLENFIVLPQGGAIRRPGTRFVAEVKDSLNYTRLIPFEFSTTQTYMIEAGNLYFRFYRDDGQIQVSGTPVEVSTPYSSTELKSLNWTQSADVLFLVSPNIRPKELHRLSDTSWTISDYAFTDGPYMDVNITSTTLTPSGTSGSITLTASSTVGINDDQGFLSTDVGRYIRFKDNAGNWTWMEITGVTSTTVVTVTIKGPALSSVTSEREWRLGAWSDTTGWPTTVTFFGQRLVFGGTKAQPNTLWFSESDNIYSFTPSQYSGVVVDSHSITLTIANEKVNAARWLSAGSKGLAVGTTGTEIIVQPQTDSQAFSPTNREAVVQTSVGSDPVRPVRIGNSVVFVQRAGRALREFVYDFNSDGYISRDLSILSEHLFRNGAVEMAYQQNPLSVLWFIDASGGLFGLTFERDQKVFAFFKSPIAGSSSGSAVVESIATIPEDEEDRLYMVVKRTINGSTKRYIEILQKVFLEDSNIEDAFFVDSGLTGTFGTPTTTVSGLDHLEGETVTILADGATHPSKTVSGGSITLDRAASKVHVGLAFQSKIALLPIELETPNFVTVGKVKTIRRVHLRLLNTVGGRVGATETTLDEILFRDPSVPMDQAVPPFTGTKSLTIDSRFEQEVQVIVVADQPLPMTIVNILVELEFHGR